MASERIDERGADDATSIKALVGHNARRLRCTTRATQRQVAEELNRAGLRWSPTRYAQLEAGEVPITIGLLLLLAAVFDQLTPPVGLADLLETPEGQDHGLIELTPDCFALDDDVRRTLGGELRPAELARHLQVRERKPSPPPAPPADGYTHADWRVARQLGLGKAAMLALSRELWGRSLTQERDRRLGDSQTSLVERARMTAELRQQLEEELSRRLPAYLPETPTPQTTDD